MVCKTCDYCGRPATDRCLVCDRCYCPRHKGAHSYCYRCEVGTEFFEYKSDML